MRPSAADTTAFMVARDEGGLAVGCGGLRALRGEAVEIKRMYVQPALRGRGLGRLLLEALEAEAARLGFSVLRLETGPLQHEAVGLYESHGYRPIPCWGAYAELPGTLCFERSLTPAGP